MELREILVWCFFVLSLIINITLIVFVLKKKPFKPEKQLTYDAQMLLRDLMTGSALLKIEYVDKSEIFLRSPRDYSK